MLPRVPCKFLIFHWLQNCQGSGVGSIPIGRSIIFPPPGSPKIILLLSLSFSGYALAQLSPSNQVSMAGFFRRPRILSQPRQ